MYAYELMFALAAGVFLYVVYQKVKNGKPISTSLMYFPLLLGIAFVFYRIWKDGQEIARLHSEVEKAKEREKDLEMRSKQAVVEAEKVELKKHLTVAENLTRHLDEKLKIEEARHAAVVDRAGRIESWDDFWGALR